MGLADVRVSEKILGQALKDFAQRDQVIIATKVYNPMGDWYFLFSDCFGMAVAPTRRYSSYHRCQQTRAFGGGDRRSRSQT